MKQTSKEWLEDIETTIAQPKPKKVVGWYCLFYWVKDTNNEQQ
jgi:hypothetical protein